MYHQNSIKILKNKILQIFVLLFLTVSVSLLAYNEYKSIMKTTVDNLNEKIINFHIETFQKLSATFLEETNKNFIKRVSNDASLRENFERMMYLIRISTVQNLFVITQDDDKNYYFLLDSEKNASLKADIFEPFNPLGDLWDKSYQSKQIEVFHHTKNNDLWITVAYPIIEKDVVVGLIGADISDSLDVEMQTRLQSFTHFFLFMFLLSIFWFVLLYTTTLYFRNKAKEGYIDPLTRAYNRKYLYEIVLKKLPRTYQLFMLDIDFFKKVNDTYGHDVGDKVLQEVALRIMKLMRDEDTLIRLGGEEFLIFTSRLSRSQCFELAERIRESIAQTPIVYEDIICPVTISIGVNPTAKKDADFDAMLKKADDALYEAKNSGRNCVILSS